MECRPYTVYQMIEDLGGGEVGKPTTDSQGGRDGHCAPRKEKCTGRLAKKSISSVIKQRVPVKCVELISFIPCT